MLECNRASTATAVYALEIFKILWEGGDNLHHELIPLVAENRIFPVLDRATALISGTFYWAFWIAQLHTTECSRFRW